MGSANRGLISLELVVRLHGSVGQLGNGGEVLVLDALVLGNDGLLLGVVEHQELLLLISRQVLVGGGSGIDFALEDGEERVVLVLHNSLAETGEGRLEELVLDSGAGCWVGELLFDLSESLVADVANEVLEVGLS